MYTLLKRLSIIQSAMALGDHELIEMQLAPVRRFADACTDVPVCKSLQQIGDALAQGRFTDAEQAIRQFLQSQHQLAVYQDGEWQALKMEAAALEKQMLALEQQKDDCSAQLNEFNRLYYQHLGDKLERVLALRAAQAYRTLQSAQADSQAHTAFREAEQDYQNFQQENSRQAQQPQPQQLNPEQSQLLKQAYRKASHLCHPDRVADKLKEEAKKMFQQLSEAYRQNDLAAVESMLAQLQTNGKFAEDDRSQRDKEQLRRHIAHLRECIAKLENELAELAEDETYQLIESLAGDYDDYFAETAAALEAEIAELSARLAQATA